VGRRIVIWALIGVILVSVSCGGFDGLQSPIPPAAIVGDNSGGAIAVCQIWRMSDSYVQFYVQKISRQGDLLWGENGVLMGSGYGAWRFHGDVHAVTDGSGGAIVIWPDFPSQPEEEPSSLQTHVARIDSEGNIKWRRDIPGINLAITDGSGGVIIAYTDSYDEIAVLKVDAGGNLPWGQDGVSLNLGEPYAFPIGSDGLGGVIVVAPTLRGSNIISAQRVDSNGNVLWQTGGVQACVGPAEGAQVVSDGAGGAIIAYMRGIPCEDGIGWCDTDIYAQRIDAEGNVLWGPDGVPICAGPSHPNSPRIVADGAGGAIIFFTFVGSEVSAPGYFAIRAQRIDADGHKLWDEDVEVWPIGYHSLVSDGFGGGISVQYGGDGRSAGAQRLDATGRKLWGPDGTTLTLPDLHSDSVVQDGCGGALISWTAVKFKGEEVSQVSYYVQRIDAEGNLPWGDEGILLNP
jgi:hypothetical protein